MSERITDSSDCAVIEGESDDYLALDEGDLRRLDEALRQAREITDHRTPSERTRAILDRMRECETPSERFRLAQQVMGEKDPQTA